ncbi:MAG: 3'-5' exonuclease [Bacteroidales bacterium]|nr:3'-5' exonuclease [Bacteroidales bacterium]
MKYLFFDTETTGFPPKARLVQIAWQVWDNNQLISKKNYIIYPNGFTIPDEVAKIHGITTEIAIKKGEDLGKVMSEFDTDINTVDKIVAHNYRFDAQIVMGEYQRLSMMTVFSQIPHLDTMKESTNYLKLPNKNPRYKGFKFPKLEELHVHLFNEKFDNAHSADADVDATVKCFFELQSRGII